MELAARSTLAIGDAPGVQGPSSHRDESDLYVMCMDANHRSGATGATSGRVVCGLSGGALACVDVHAGRPGLSLAASTARAHGAGGVAGVASLSSGRALSCGADGAVRLWDFRASASQRSACGEWMLGDEVTCIACAEDDSMIACGTERGIVHLFDLRKVGSVPSACITEAHTEPVCHVSFSSRSDAGATYLMTAGVDGLLCVFDMSDAMHSKRFKEEERYVSVLNSQSSVAVARMFGKSGKETKAFAITHDQTLSVFDWQANTSLAYSRCAREEATAAASMSSCGASAGVDYIITGGFDEASERLLVATGSAHGDVTVFPIRNYEIPGTSNDMEVDGGDPMTNMESMFEPPVAHLRNGHGGNIVRCALFSPYESPCVCLLTGCEGGFVSLWDTNLTHEDAGNERGGADGSGGGNHTTFKARRKPGWRVSGRPY